MWIVEREGKLGLLTPLARKFLILCGPFPISQSNSLPRRKTDSESPWSAESVFAALSHLFPQLPRRAVSLQRAARPIPIH